MKKLKILGIVLLLGFSLFYGTKGINFLLKEFAKKKIVKILNKETGDKFRFIYGLDYNLNFSTNIRYRGILYSEKLEKLGWSEGVEIGLENLSIDNSTIRYIVDSYEGTLKQIEIDGYAEKKARELFGEKTNLYNDGSTTEYMYEVIVKKRGQDLPPEEKVGYYSTIVNYFVEDLDKIDKEDIKKKTFELAKIIYHQMNYRSALQIYIRDNKYFENIDLVYGSIYPPFRNREDIVKILDKIKAKEKITEEEKVALVRVFNKGGLDFDILPYRKSRISLSDIKNGSELTLDKIYLSE